MHYDMRNRDMRKKHVMIIMIEQIVNKTRGPDQSKYLLHDGTLTFHRINNYLC